MVLICLLAPPSPKDSFSHNKKQTHSSFKSNTLLLFGTDIPCGQRVNSQIGREKKKKYPKLPKRFFVCVFTLKAAILYICIQPSYVRSDAVLLYILTSYITA